MENIETLLAAVAQTQGFDDDENFASSPAIRRDEGGSQTIGAPVEVTGDLRSREAAVPAPSPVQVSSAGEKKKTRGRPPKGFFALEPVEKKRKKEEEQADEDVCFICFDGGSLVLCDRKGCPKAYHPACIKRDEAFFRSKAKWNCGWHICSVCQKSSHYMCYTCTFSLCKGCSKDSDYLSVRGNKGFCTTCLKTIMLIENKDQASNDSVQVDFDDRTSWEYLFKVYWVLLKEKLLLTLHELTQAKRPGNNAPATGDNCKPRSTQVHHHVSTSCTSSEHLNKSQKEGVNVSQSSQASTSNKEETTEWASNDLLEFVSHMRNGDTSSLSQFDVQNLVLEYIKRNNLRDPSQKSQIVCDPRLKNLFGKARVGHIEMLKLLEFHFLIKDDSSKNSFVPAGFVGPAASDVQGDGNSSVPSKSKKRKTFKKNEETEPPRNDLNGFAAIDVHNINLIYLRRNLMENLIDDKDNFHDKVVGSIVRIRISTDDQKPDIYRLVNVVGTLKVAEPYKIGDRKSDIMLECLNLDKKEIVSIDSISNQAVTEDDCRRLRQSIRCGLGKLLTVGEIQNKAMTLQPVRFNNLMEAEILRLSHLRDRASENGRKKDLREYVQKLQLLKSPEERQRRISQVPEIHADPKMNPNYESDEDAKRGDNGKKNEHEGQTHSKFTQSGSNPIVPNNKAKEEVSSIHTPKTEKIDATSASFGNSPPSLCNIETEKLWHYRDPSGKIQGPFAMMQLRKWSTTGLFPADMRIWTNHEQYDSLLLTDAMNRQFHGASELPPVEISSESQELSGATGGIEGVNGGTGTNRKVTEGSWCNNANNVLSDPVSSWPNFSDLLKDNVQERSLLPSSSLGLTLPDQVQESDEKKSIGLSQNHHMSNGQERENRYDSQTPAGEENPRILPVIDLSMESGSIPEHVSKLSGSIQPDGEMDVSILPIENRGEIQTDDKQPSDVIPIQNPGAILELLSPTPRSSSEETKQSELINFMVPNPGPTWNVSSDLSVNDGIQHPDEWDGYSPTPATKAPVQGWDLDLDLDPISGSPVKLPAEDGIAAAATSTPNNNQQFNWIELDPLSDDLMAEMLGDDGIESQADGLPSPTSFTKELSKDDCFSSISSLQDPGKSDAFSSTNEIKLTCHSSTPPCKQVLDSFRRSSVHSSVSSEGETNAPVQEAGSSEFHPPAPNNTGQETMVLGSGLENADPGRGMVNGTVQGNINLVTVQGNVNLVLGGPSQGMTNIGWGTNSGPSWGNPNLNPSLNLGSMNGSLAWDGQQQRAYGGEWFPSPREWAPYPGNIGDAGFGRGRPPWGRQPYNNNGGGGGSGFVRPAPKRVLCKFYESGHCKKGAYCDYLHQ